MPQEFPLLNMLFEAHANSEKVKNVQTGDQIHKQMQSISWLDTRIVHWAREKTGKCKEAGNIYYKMHKYTAQETKIMQRKICGHCRKKNHNNKNCPSYWVICNNGAKKSLYLQHYICRKKKTKKKVYHMQRKQGLKGWDFVCTWQWCYAQQQQINGLKSSN